MFNPTWQEEGDFDSGFNEAVDFAARVLARAIAAASGGLNAKAIVAEAIKNAQDPRVIVLEKYTPWKKTVHALSDQALYMVYPSQSGQWMSLVHSKTENPYQNHGLACRMQNCKNRRELLTRCFVTTVYLLPVPHHLKAR